MTRLLLLLALCGCSVTHLRGSVTYSNGEPTADAKLKILEGNSGSSYEEYQTDSFGQFYVPIQEYYAENGYLILVEHPNHPPHTALIQDLVERTEASDDGYIKITLPPPPRTP